MSSPPLDSQSVTSLPNLSMSGVVDTGVQLKLLLRVDGNWDTNDIFNARYNIAIQIPHDISFASLVESLKAAISNDTQQNPIRLSYLVQSCPPPIAINDDADFCFYIKLKLHQNEVSHQPLCIEVLRNSTTNIDSCDVVAPTQHLTTTASDREITNRQIPSHAPNHGGNVFAEAMQYNEQITTPRIDIISHYHPTSIRLLSIYKSKQDLCHHLQMYAVTNHFQYWTKTSNKSSLHIVCLDEQCSWAVRAVRIDNGDLFQIRRFDKEHTCKVYFREGDHKEATSELVADLVKHHYLDATKNQYSPNEICQDMRLRYGVFMSYKKALMVKHKALTKLYGTDDESYQLLPSLCHVLEQKNPGSSISLLISEYHRLKYFFFTLAAWKHAWDHCIPVLIIDGTFMKSYFKRTLLTACCQDANKQIIPIAFGICDTEDKSSWSWFLKEVKRALTVRHDMYIVSDRHEGILYAVNDVFPNTPHDYCTEHLARNIGAKFKGPKEDLYWKFRAAARAATEVEREEYLTMLDAQDPRVRTYLAKIDETRWAHCKSGLFCYSVMTSNSAESLNNVNKSARDYPVIKLVDFIRERMQKWFHERFEKASSSTTILPKKLEAELISLQHDAFRMRVKPASGYEFEVVDGWSRTFIVNLREKSCTCGDFQLDHFVCVHVVAAIATRPSLSCYNFVSSYYKREALVGTYMGIVHPIEDKLSWCVPESVKSVICLPPSCNKRPPGRPKKRRYPSVGEFCIGSVRRKQWCTRCQTLGHNKKTCTNPIPHSS